MTHALCLQVPHGVKGGELIQVEVPKSSAHNMHSVIQVCLFSVMSASGARLIAGAEPPYW